MSVAASREVGSRKPIIYYICTGVAVVKPPRFCQIRLLLVFFFFSLPFCPRCCPEGQRDRRSNKEIGRGCQWAPPVSCMAPSAWAPQDGRAGGRSKIIDDFRACLFPPHFTSLPFPFPWLPFAGHYYLGHSVTVEPTKGFDPAKRTHPHHHFAWRFNFTGGVHRQRPIEECKKTTWQ